MSKEPQKPLKKPEPVRTAAPPRPAGAPAPLHTAWKWLLTALILAHLMIVIAVPLGGMMRPRSLLAERLVGYVEPYVHIFQVSHGYAFFAPDPGPSHLVDYELLMPDGKVETGRIPDRKKEWPRLLYHRHFMLTEKLDGSKLGLPPNLQWPGYDGPADDWQGSEFTDIAKSYADHLKAVSGASQVRLFHVHHRDVDPVDFIKGQRLDDPKLYVRSEIDLTPRKPALPVAPPPSAEEIRIPGERSAPEGRP